MNPFYCLFGAILIFVGRLAAYQEPLAGRPRLFTVLTGIAVLGMGGLLVV